MTACAHPTLIDVDNTAVSAHPYRSTHVDADTGAPLIYTGPLRYAVACHYAGHTQCLTPVVHAMASDDDQVLYAVLTAAFTTLVHTGISLHRHPLTTPNAAPFDAIITQSVADRRAGAAGTRSLPQLLGAMTPQARAQAILTALDAITTYAPTPADVVYAYPQT